MGPKQLSEYDYQLLWIVSGLIVLGEDDSPLDHCPQGRFMLTAPRPQFDPYKAAEISKYNVHNPVAPANTPSGSATGGGVKKPAPKATFRTLADLGGD